MAYYRADKKLTTDDLLQLSIGWLKRHKYLLENAKINGVLTWKRYSDGCPPRKIAFLKYIANFIGEERSITLRYTYNGTKDIEHKILVTYSIPYYGGKRYWFICPKCGRKVAFLYGAKYFLCRHCQNLSYPTQQMDLLDRMLERSKKYQNKVLLDGRKKRWIHHRTFEKYMDKSEYYEGLGLVSMYSKLRKSI